MRKIIKLGNGHASPSLVHLAVSSILMAANGMASAAEISDKSAMLEEVVVTGLRESLTKAADIKRNAEGVVEAITAEDIGKFPDTNLAESLQRVSGVSIDRTNGEGNQVSVRGFGPSFNLVTLNGRQMPSAASPKQEGADSQLQSRSFNFAEIAAESVAGVEVYKTSRADAPSGGIGATVNIKTARPLDLKSFTAAGSIEAQKDASNSVGHAVTPEFSGLISDTFADGRFGVLVNGSYSKRDSREQIAATDGWIRGNASDPSAAGIDSSAINPSINPGRYIWVPRNLLVDASDHSRKRVNGQLVLQFRPIDSLTTTLDYTYSDYKDTIHRAQTAVWFQQDTIVGKTDANGTVINPSVAANPARGTGAFDFNAYDDIVQTTNKSIGFNAAWQAPNNLLLTFDAHNSKSHAQPDGQSSDYLSILSSQTVVNYAADYSGATQVPVLSYNTVGGVDPFDTHVLRPNITLERGNEMENKIKQFQLAAKWTNASDSALKAISFGVGSLNYEVNTNFIFDLTVYGQPTCAACSNLVTVMPRGSLGSQWSGGNSLPPTFISFSSSAVRAALPGLGFPSVFNLVNPVINDVQEKTTSGFVNFDYSTAFNGLPFSAVAGVRYEHTSTTGGTLGFPPQAMIYLSPTELRPVNSTTQQFFKLKGAYDVFLPSFDARLDLNKDLVGRFSYGRSLARPDLNRLRPNLSITDSRPGGPYRAIQGNPGLLPYISDNIDLSLEWYYSKGSYVAVSYFIKFVNNYVVSTTTRGPIVGAAGYALTDPNPGNVVGFPPNTIGGPNDQVITWDITTPTNGESAKVHGLELAAQHLFGDSGFGLQANATFVNGNVKYDVTKITQSVSLTGLSNSANFVAFYDKHGIQARLAYNWRDTFLLATDQLRQPNEPVFTKAYGQLDASASYALNDRLTVLVEALNLNDGSVFTHGRFANQFINAYHSGRRYAAGVRFKF